MLLGMFISLIEFYYDYNSKIQILNYSTSVTFHLIN